VDTNALSTSTRRAFAPPHRRLWAVLAAVVIVAGVLLASATQPRSVFAGSVASIVISPTGTTIAAGGSQTYTVEGFNNGGNSTGDVTAETSFTTTPSVGASVGCAGNACGPTVVGTYTVTATHVDGATTTTSLTVDPGPAANATFSHPPIATEKGTPIYSACRPPSGGTAPCALSGAAATDSTSVRVHVTDAYGNAIAPQTVTVSSGASALGSASTTNGTADFGDTLTIATVGNYTLTAQVTSGPTTARPSTAGVSVAIVNDLQACTGTSCANNANNGLGSKQLQRAYGEITTTSTFYGGTNNVLLTTQFVPGSETNQCGNSTIGQAVDMTVSGSGTSATAPSTQMLLVIPREALKYYGIASRGTGSFEVCLGALNISDDDDSVVTPWQQKKIEKKAISLIDSVLDDGRFWGVPADCGTAGIAASDPCIGLRTKNVGQLQSYMNLTAEEIAAIGVRDSDLMIVIDKEFPWDGKGGVY
jgi:hypothetical protein